MRIFLSHAKEDAAYAEAELVPLLKGAGHDVLFSSHLITSTDWHEWIQAQIPTADCMLVVCSTRAYPRPAPAPERWIRTEVGAALEQRAGRHVFPVRIEPCDVRKIHFKLGSFHWLDLFGDGIEAARLKLVRDLRLVEEGIEREGSVTAAAARPAPSRHEAWDSHTHDVIAALSPPERRDLLSAALAHSPLREALPVLLWFWSCDEPHLRREASSRIDREGVALRAALTEIGQDERPRPFELALTALERVRSSGSVQTALRALGRLAPPERRSRVLRAQGRQQAEGEMVHLQERIRRAGEKGLELERALGMGSLTVSFLARLTASGVPVVVRALRPVHAEDPVVSAAFQECVSRAEHLANHQGLVRTRWSRAEDDDLLYYVVRDFVQGRTLDLPRPDGRPWEPRAVLKVLRQIVRALEQSGLYRVMPAHGGLRPTNVFVCADDGEERVVLGDPFPLLPAAALGALQRPESLGYLWPEAYRAKPGRERDPAFGLQYDLYGLGSIAYLLLTGRPPYQADTAAELLVNALGAPPTRPSLLVPSVPAELDALVFRLLGREPSAAPTRLSDVATWLEAAGASSRRAAGPTSPPTMILTQTMIGQAQALVPSVVAELPLPDAAGTTTFGSTIDLTPAGWASTRVGLAQPRGTEAGPPTARDLASPTAQEPGGPPAGDPPQRDVAPRGAALTGPAEQEERPPSGPPSGTGAGDTTGAGPAGVADREGGRADLRGQLVGDRYQAGAQLGQGGMSVVYEASDLRLAGRQVVIKLLRPHLLTDPSVAERFVREMRSLAHVHHPNIVPILDAGKHEGVPYLVIKYLGGGSLADRLSRDRAPQSLTEALAWAAPIADALDALHALGFVHRDVKPANILFDERGIPHLADFGVTRSLSQTDTAITGEGSWVGTPRYMPPEAAFDADRLDPRSDQYALALVVCEALSGEVPMNDASPFLILNRRANAGKPVLPRSLEEREPLAVMEVLAKALDRDPMARYGSCKAFVEALGLAARPSPPPPLDLDLRVTAAPRRARRRRCWWWPFGR